MDASWCDTFSEFNECLYNQILDSDTKVMDNCHVFETLSDFLENYLYNVKSKDVILIKTSVTGKRSGWHEIRIDLLENIFSICHKLCPQNPIFLCDGPAYIKDLEKEYKRLNWMPLIRKYNISIMDLNYGDTIFIDNIWPVSVSWVNASKIINVCKAKTHKRFGVSLSTKNLLGTLSGSIMGYPKLSNKHENVPRFLFSLLEQTPSMFNIIDGVKGVEGNGPMHGSRAKSDFVVMGTEGYMCDARAVIEMGFHPAVVPALIVPLLHKEKCAEKIPCNLKELRQTDYDFLPNISCAWMYRSLGKGEELLEDIYLNLLGGIKECWINYPKNM